jgi:hypothetical protein
MFLLVFYLVGAFLQHFIQLFPVLDQTLCIKSRAALFRRVLGALRVGCYVSSLVTPIAFDLLVFCADSVAARCLGTARAIIIFTRLYSRSIRSGIVGTRTIAGTNIVWPLGVTFVLGPGVSGPRMAHSSSIQIIVVRRTRRIVWNPPRE